MIKIYDEAFKQKCVQQVVKELKTENDFCAKKVACRGQVETQSIFDSFSNTASH